MKKFVSKLRGLTRNKLWAIGFVALLVVFLWPAKANGQFGLDPCCAIISAGLESISNLLKSAVAAPLSGILQVQQQEADFEQQIIYPASAIANARGLAGQFQTELARLRQISGVNVQSATLPGPQQLEQMLLSSNPANVDSVNANYSVVFGPVMSPAAAPQAVRDAVDASDAEAQAALKKAILVDAMADAELQAADDLNQQLQNASPGSAPILEAQASAWLLRANAYSQTAIAELIRVRSIELANESAHLKFTTAHTTTLQNNVNQSLQRSK